MVTIARLATSGGVRAPLAHLADQVFLDITRELRAQGMRRKVIADMFGITLRAYHARVQRLQESATDRDKSLWQAVYQHMAEHPGTRVSSFNQRCRRDNPATVASIVRDLQSAGLVQAEGLGKALTLVDRERTSGDLKAFEVLVWSLVYRHGPLSRSALEKLVPSSTMSIRMY